MNHFIFHLSSYYWTGFWTDFFGPNKTGMAQNSTHFYLLPCEVLSAGLGPSAVTLFALAVDRDIIWPIVSARIWENHGSLPSVASRHTLQIWFDIWSVGGSFPPGHDRLF